MNACHLQLLLPRYFEEMPIGKIRKALKLMAVEPHRNEDAHERLRQFFPEWERSLKGRLGESMEALKAEERKVRAAESQAACFGTMATKEMKDGVKAMQDGLKRAARAVKNADALVARCGKVIEAYKQIQGN